MAPRGGHGAGEKGLPRPRLNSIRRGGAPTARSGRPRPNPDPKRRSPSRSPPRKSASRSPRPRSPKRRSTSRSPPRRRGRSRSRDRSRSRSPDDRNPGNNLYVTGLSTRVTEEDLQKFFSKEGKIIVWFVIPVIKYSSAEHNNNILVLIVLAQYLPRLYLIFPLTYEIVKATGVVAKTAWQGAAYNMVLYLIASHIHTLGSLSAIIYVKFNLW